MKFVKYYLEFLFIALSQTWMVTFAYALNDRELVLHRETAENIEQLVIAAGS